MKNTRMKRSSKIRKLPIKPTQIIKPALLISLKSHQKRTKIRIHMVSKKIMANQ